MKKHRWIVFLSLVFTALVLLGMANFQNAMKPGPFYNAAILAGTCYLTELIGIYMRLSDGKPNRSDDPFLLGLLAYVASCIGYLALLRFGPDFLKEIPVAYTGSLLLVLMFRGHSLWALIYEPSRFKAEASK